MSIRLERKNIVAVGFGVAAVFGVSLAPMPQALACAADAHAKMSAAQENNLRLLAAKVKRRRLAGAVSKTHASTAGKMAAVEGPSNELGTGAAVKPSEIGVTK